MTNGFDRPNTRTTTTTIYASSTTNNIRTNYNNDENDGGIFTTEYEIPPLQRAHNNNDTPTIGAPALPVIVTNSPKTIETWLTNHCHTSNSDRRTTILGFDTESIAKTAWHPHRAKLPNGPATLQLSTPTSCLIVHLARCNNSRGVYGTAASVPGVVQAVLADETVVKAGVAIDEDAIDIYRWGCASSSTQHQGVLPGMKDVWGRDHKRLSEQWVVRSRFDLGCIAGGSPHRRAGLRQIAEVVEGVDLPKSKKLTMSDWGGGGGGKGGRGRRRPQQRGPLTPAQVAYAARDAWVAASAVDTLCSDRPDVFGAEAIRRIVSEERDVGDMESRATRRKAARIEWKALKEEDGNGGGDGEETKRRIQELWKIMQGLKPDPPFVFCGEDLGLDWPVVSRSR